MKTTKKTVEDKAKRTPRFLLLMPEDVRHDIEKSAIAHGRTLTAEINLRLRASLKWDFSVPTGTAPVKDIGTDAMGGPMPLTIGRAGAKHSVQQEPAAYPVATDGRTEQAMLTVFRSLPPEKQLALLSLFR